MPKIHPLVLASGSPRRSEILQRLCIPFEVSPADIDETPKKDEGAKAMVLRLAKGKAAAAATKFPGRWVLAADSIVAQNGRPFGKPKTKNDAAHILHRLSGKKHQVFTAICLRKDDEIHSTIETTHVYFRPLQAKDIRWYIETGEPMDKAGAYGIQGAGARFVRRLEGSYSNVMGLPIEKLIDSLNKWHVFSA